MNESIILTGILYTEILYMIIVFSIEDLKSGRLVNYDFIFPLILSTRNLIYIFLNYSIELILLYFSFELLCLLILIFLYYFKMIGGADFKVIVVLFILYFPLNTTGISKTYDGIQFLFIFILYIQLNPFNNFFHNLRKIKSSKNRIQLKNISVEVLFMCRLTYVSDISKFDCIPLKLKKNINSYSKFYNILLLDFRAMVWVSKYKRLIPTIFSIFLITLII